MDGVRKYYTILSRCLTKSKYPSECTYSILSVLPCPSAAVVLLFSSVLFGSLLLIKSFPMLSTCLLDIPRCRLRWWWWWPVSSSDFTIVLSSTVLTLAYQPVYLPVPHELRYVFSTCIFPHNHVIIL